MAFAVDTAGHAWCKLEAAHRDSEAAVMSSLFMWMAALALSTVLLLMTAAKGAFYLHILVCAVVTIALAVTAIHESRTLRAQGASVYAVASSNARFMGLVWAWGAVTLFTTYNFVLSWKEWVPFFIAFFVAAGICSYFAGSLKKDEVAGASDPVMKTIGRYLTIAQVAGMAIAAVGLVIDGKLNRFAKARPGWEDWAANNIFFFGAVSLAAIGIHALVADHREAKA